MDGPPIALDTALSLDQLTTTGSLLHINDIYEDADDYAEPSANILKNPEYIGEPVKCFKEFENELVAVDDCGLVKKKILEEGGGMPLTEANTVCIEYSGYWENEQEPFDSRTWEKPLLVDLSDSGLLPGLQIAVKSMLVGEVAVFLLSYKLMYGELGVPPRIKPKADCVFTIKLVKSTITNHERDLNLSEPNMFQRVRSKVKRLYSSGLTLFKISNVPAAISMFRKGIFMLHKCRLADEEEENIQIKLLVKLYTNLAICHNKIQQPLKTCTACNELNRLNALWNNGKALFQNAKALRMIGCYDEAEKKLNRAMRMQPHSSELQQELELLEKTREIYYQNKALAEVTRNTKAGFVSDEFKTEVEGLIKNFMDNVNICRITLPAGLTPAEIQYTKEVCLRENLFIDLGKGTSDVALDKDNNTYTAEEINDYEDTL